MEKQSDSYVLLGKEYQPEKLWTQSLRLFVCIMYMGCATGLVLLNRHIISVEDFPFPWTLSLLGTSFSFVASFTYCIVRNVHNTGSTVNFTFFLTTFIPIGGLAAISLFTGNLVYMYLSMSAIQLLKSITPVVLLLLLWVCKLKRPTWLCVLSVCLITGGFIVSSLGKLKVVAVGVVIMLLSVLAEALRLAAKQYMLRNLHFHPLELLMYLGAACSMWLLSGVLAFEWQHFESARVRHKFIHQPWLYFCAGMAGFVVNALGCIVIKLTSSLTLKISSACKDAIVVLGSVIFLHDKVPGLQGYGYAVSMVGLGLYVCSAYDPFFTYSHKEEGMVVALEAEPMKGTGSVPHMVCVQVNFAPCDKIVTKKDKTVGTNPGKLNDECLC